MNDRTLPIWLKLAFLASTVSQLFFGVTLMFNPAAISQLWPWELTPFTTRLLAASTLVSVPMQVLAIYVNRWSAVRIPLVMLVTYRLLQLTAGLLHLDRFDLTSLQALNYFGSGGVLLIALAVSLFWGNRFGQEVSSAHPFLRGDAPLKLPAAASIVYRALSVLYFVVGLTYLILGQAAEFAWAEPAGTLTGLTARLFASPTMGLALAMWLITRATRWSEVGIPAIGMITFGAVGLITVALDFASIAPPTPLGYLVPLTPLVLLLAGGYLLLPARSAA